MWILLMVIFLILNVICVVFNIQSKRPAAACFNAFAAGFMTFALALAATH